MKVKVFQPNANGKIEFTPAELEDLLNEIYSDGFNEGESKGANKSSYTWTAPGFGTWYSEVTPSIINSTVTNEHDKGSSKPEKPHFKTPVVELKCSPADLEKVTKAVSHLMRNTGIETKTNVFDKLAKELDF